MASCPDREGTLQEEADMQQAELVSIVNGLKADFETPGKLDGKSVGDRADSANTAALDMLLEICGQSEEGTSMLEQAQTLKALSQEFNDITQVIEGLAP